YVDPYTDTLWMGSLEGLAVYDATTERWLGQTDQGLPFENVTSLAADSRHLWISARHGAFTGVWLFDRTSQHWHSQALPPGPYTLVSGQGVLAIDPPGVVYRYTQQEWRTVATLHATPARPLIAAYHSSRLWVA